jgi:hypothetical protein
LRLDGGLLRRLLMGVSSSILIRRRVGHSLALLLGSGERPVVLVHVFAKGLLTAVGEYRVCTGRLDTGFKAIHRSEAAKARIFESSVIYPKSRFETSGTCGTRRRRVRVVQLGLWSLAGPRGLCARRCRTGSPRLSRGNLIEGTAHATLAVSLDSGGQDCCYDRTRQPLDAGDTAAVRGNGERQRLVGQGAGRVSPESLFGTCS